ncbi:conserved hypothetical protein [Segniliparus rotundus DSM 44985]|uniref:Uncharacterized protein n=1 Tax=Segniliparus rotundus (strain ATCC BAA-972 / CDC 1076 / CIP 108378 / DSM 44985 / JCM 13578) TaxID=640132 RepID=D6Z9M8_SEGRD|nr:hypothetical protein [Segniliparus rotundus]ADG96555.1 conserved hypothetical protein [Segniliparus rotundus DSM 44985]
MSRGSSRHQVLGPVARAVETGSEIDRLNALQARLAGAIDDEGTPPRDLAALTRRLQDVSERLDSLMSEKAEQVAAIVEDERWDGSAI